MRIKKTVKRAIASFMLLAMLLSSFAATAATKNPEKSGIYDIKSLAMSAELVPQKADNTSVSVAKNTAIDGKTYDFYPEAVRFQLKFTGKSKAMYFVQVKKGEPGQIKAGDAAVYVNQYTAGDQGLVSCTAKKAPYPTALQNGVYTVLANNTPIATFRYFSSWLLGDYDENGRIDQADAYYLLMYTMKPEDFSIHGRPADFDNNRRVDQADAYYLLMYTMKPEDFPLKIVS